jgi:hypothetical protein
MEWRPDRLHRAARHPVCWTLVDVAVVFGAVGWVYVAVIAVFVPKGLFLPLVEGIPIRRDTFGTVSFAVSATACFAREIRKHSADGLGLGARAVQRAAPATAFIYSSAVAIYLMANSTTHPHTMALPLTHLVDWPTEATMLKWAVVASVVSFFFLRWAVQSAHNPEEVE